MRVGFDADGLPRLQLESKRASGDDDAELLVLEVYMVAGVTADWSMVNDLGLGSGTYVGRSRVNLPGLAVSADDPRDG